ncbi:MAG TPA: cytochrome c oxidase subunit 2A [Chitinophagaceae bacterium]|nr:cytochrome c oxidase subunit 2A [Chitinophagaceae bacterium]
MESPNEKKFVPKGAMAFFILLILLTLAFFYGIYLLMIDRV